MNVGLSKVGNRAKPLKYSGGGKKKVVFSTNLEQMFKHKATDLDTQPTMMQHRLACDTKVPGCCLMFAPDSEIQMIRSSSESNGNVYIRALMWPHRKKSIGARSGDMGDQDSGLPRPIQRLS